MEEASAHSLVGVPVIQGNSKPLRFSKWEPGCHLKKGPFDVQIPVNTHYFAPEVLIIPMKPVLTEITLNGRVRPQPQPSKINTKYGQIEGISAKLIEGSRPPAAFQ